MEGLKHFILGCMFLWRVHPQVFLHQLQLCQCSQVHHHLLVQEVHQLRQHIPHRPHTRLPTHPTLLLLWVPAQAQRYSGLYVIQLYILGGVEHKGKNCLGWGWFCLLEQKLAPDNAIMVLGAGGHVFCWSLRPKWMTQILMSWGITKGTKNRRWKRRKCQNKLCFVYYLVDIFLSFEWGGDSFIASCFCFFFLYTYMFVCLFAFLFQ